MILYLLLRVYGGKTIDITIQPMLNTGTSPLPWEPYTGGQPSPSPDYPQQIVSAGAGGEVEVTICGKNLFDGNTDISKTQYYKLPIQMKKGAKLTMSFIGVGTGTGPAKAYCHDSRGVYCGTLFYFDIKSGVNKYSSTIICMGGEERIYFYNTDFSHFFEKIYDIQIEINGIATDYAPYREPQSFSISTPTGLPAIPVDSDGNYTDANGQQWIADYIDLKRGKYVQNVKEIPVSDNMVIETWGVNANADNVTGFYAYMDGNNLPMPGSEAMMSTIIKYRKEVWGGITIGCSMNCNNIPYAMLCIRTDTLEDTTTDANAVKSFLTLCKKTDAHFYYVLADPIERDLTPEEIQAYKNLVTYAGTTIVENDAECYMEVSAGGGDGLRAKKLALILGE